jgi:hypothetical protein
MIAAELGGLPGSCADVEVNESAIAISERIVGFMCV